MDESNKPSPDAANGTGRATNVVPVALVIVFVFVALLNAGRGKGNESFDGVVLSTPGKYEFYPGAVDCSFKGTPYILIPSPDFDKVVTFSTDAAHMERLFYVAWRVKLRGNLSRFGIYGLGTGYWRQLDVSHVIDAKLLGCFRDSH
jgi:hypothetical protein